MKEIEKSPFCKQCNNGKASNKCKLSDIGQKKNWSIRFKSFKEKKRLRNFKIAGD